MHSSNFAFFPSLLLQNLPQQHPSTDLIAAYSKILWRIKGESAKLAFVDEGRKRVLLIAASILAARKLAQYDAATRVPATISAISDAVRWAEGTKGQDREET